MSDAMARAREIAARLRGGFGDGGPPEKRRRSGFSDAPPPGGMGNSIADIAAAAAAAVRDHAAGVQPPPSSYGAPSNYGPGQVRSFAQQPVEAALPQAQTYLFTDEPGMDFELKELHVALSTIAQPVTSCRVFMPEDGLTNYMGLVLGPKGSSLKAMQDKYRSKIVVRGKGCIRGAAFEPDPSPDDDLQMHVSVTGPRDAVAFLEREYHAMFTNAEKRREVKQRQMDAMVTVTGDGLAGSTQLALVGGALVASTSSGDGWRVVPSQPRQGEKTYEARVPNGMVGLVIGRGGDNIKRLNAEFGVRVQVAKAAEPRKTPDADETRRIAITGTPQGIDRAKRDLGDMIKQRKATGGWSTGPCKKSLVVDNSKVGLIIGKGGLTVKGIQERSGANIAIPSEPDSTDPLKRTLTVSGPTDESVREASVEIENMLRSHDLNAGFTGTDDLMWGPPTPVAVPEGCVGLIIGKGGETIQRLQQGTGARIQIPNDTQPGSDPPMRIIMVAGLPQQRQNAHYEIQLLVEQHNQRNPQYLGSSAMVDPYAEVLLAPDAYYQDFWNYAGWYGEEAARQTYGAYAPPAGSIAPAAEPAVPGMPAAEPAVPGMAAPGVAAAAPVAAAQTYGAAPMTYAADYAAVAPGTYAPTVWAADGTPALPGVAAPAPPGVAYPPGVAAPVPPAVPGASPGPPAFIAPGAGRGRGTTLPAWMTNADAQPPAPAPDPAADALVAALATPGAPVPPAPGT